MSLLEKKHNATYLEDNLEHPQTHIVTRPALYNVALGTAPITIPFSAGVSRLTVRFDSGVGINSFPFKVKIPYKRVGNPSGMLRLAIRTTGTDAQRFIADWPIVANPTYAFGENVNQWYEITIEGANDIPISAGDRLSLEFPSGTDTIAIGSNTQVTDPTGFVCQRWTGSYVATSNPLAISIVGRVLTPI